MQAILSSWFIQGMIKATSDMWHKGWDERNGGNISLRLLAEEVEPYRRDFTNNPAKWSSRNRLPNWQIAGSLSPVPASFPQC